ncbi:MAG: flagellar hook-associated protein FlgL, partial [Synergistaceae bacterium]|nr:flagellar hook-associated protein FlgL [Synergistaceae bacterium]
MSYRVTNSMMQTLLLNDMHNNLNNMLKVQQQISTQRKYGSASDNPNAVTKGMAIETMMTEGEQYIKNLRDAESWLKFTDDALMDINDLFQRMRELAIYAGDPALTDVDREAIGEELRQLKAEMMSFANSTIEGRYLFSGLTTDKVPFSLGAGGEVVYNGSDYELFWEFARGETGQVSLTGRDVFPLDETTNYLKGIEVPIGFEWKGRNEILEFKIGFRTVKVRIPERWTDEIANGVDDSEDYNRFRDPGEPLEGYSLQEIADLINNSTEMGDTSQLLKATVVTDTARGVQYLKIKSLTGEPVSLTSWPEADMQSMAEGIMGKSVATGYTAPADGKIEIRFMDSKVYSIDVEVGDGLADIVGKLNSLQDGRIWAALKTDGTNEWIDIVARNAGDEFSIDTTGSGTDLFTSGVGSEPIQMNADHTHIGFAAYMGMETSVQSKEFSSGASLGDTTDDALNIKIASGGRYADIMINDDPYLTLEELAARINGVCGDWFEAVVETDGPDGSDPFADPLDNSGENREDATQRLVLRTKDGSPFSIYDTSTSGTVHRYAESLGINTALIVPDSLVYYPDDSAGSFDENIPAILEVTVGEHVFQVRVCKNNCPTGELVAKAIVNQVNEQYGGKLLAWDENASGENFAVYALTGEPLRVVDKGYGDPRYADFTGGIAMQLEISAGIKTDAVSSIKAGDQLTPGTIRISTPGHSIDVPVIANDTLHTLAKRIQESAGSWLDVAYVDESMGTKPSAEVLMSIAAKDGS